jgi:hypothetical protein
MPVSHIFVDMDGVLCDFISAAFEVHGKKYDAETYPKLEWSIASVLGITEDEFWRVIDDCKHRFWPSLNRYPWASELLFEARSVASVSLLSTPSKSGFSHSGKRVWVDEHAPDVELILCKSKHFLAAPGRVLIDDNDGNIKKWRDNGGLGILFPQPWNANHQFTDNPLGHVFEQLHVIADDKPQFSPPQWVAFCGVARAGKDEAAKALIANGYGRRCFGDIIKRQLDDLVKRHLGFSAFTEDDTQKKQIRAALEHWGDVNYDNILDEFFSSLPTKAVNTRLVRVREAKEWKDRGGQIVEIERPGYVAASDWESENLHELRASGLIDHKLINDGTVSELHDAILELIAA